MWQCRREFVSSELTQKALLKLPGLFRKSCFFILWVSAAPHVLLEQIFDSCHAETKKRPAVICECWMHMAAAPHLGTLVRPHHSVRRC